MVFNPHAIDSGRSESHPFLITSGFPLYLSFFGNANDVAAQVCIDAIWVGRSVYRIDTSSVDDSPRHGMDQMCVRQILV